MSDICEIVNENQMAETTDQEIFTIKKGEFEYNLKLKSNDAKIVISIRKQNEKNKLFQFYERKLYLEEIQLLHQNFSKFTYCQQFLKYLKNQEEKNNLEISADYNNLSLKLKLENILIDIHNRTEPNLENLEQAINYLNEGKCDINKSINELKENKKLNEEINELKSFNKKLEEENEQIKKELKIIIDEIEKLKKENKNDNMSNKIKQSADNSNKILPNKNEIISMDQINNNKKLEKKISNIKNNENQLYKKIIPIININKDREIPQVILNNKKKLDNLIKNEEAKNNDSFDNRLNNISKGRNYNKMTHKVIKNKNDITNLKYSKDVNSKTIYHHDKNLSKNYSSFLQYRTNNSNNEKTDNNALLISVYSNEKENDVIKDEKYINLRNFSLEIKNSYNRNIGPILQCMLNNKNLIDYFLNQAEEIKNNKDNGILSYSLLELIESICFNKNIKESLNNFKNVIDKLEASLSNKNQNNNSKNFIQFFINKLHKELNKVENVDNNMKKCSDKNIDNDINNFEKYFQNNFNSIISGLFYFSNISQTNCTRCNIYNINRNNIEINFLLVFSLEKIKEFIGKNKKIISINDCLSFYKKTKNIRQVCDKCKKKDKLENNNLILKSPKILIICLNNDVEKLDFKYQLEEKINLDNFIYYKNNSNDYELVNVVYYLKNKNYITFCKNFTDYRWYLYDKQKCIQYNSDSLKDKGIPLLLFYSKVEN